MSRLIVIALLAVNLVLLGYAAVRVVPTQTMLANTPDPVSPPRRWPPGTPEIQLLAEMPAPETAADPERLCWSVGPFETPASRDAVREVLLDGVGAIVDRQSEALVELGYWVTLPSYPSMAAAVTGMQELTRAGLHDIAVVTDDTGQYRISLGYFLQESNARRRRNQLRDLGYEAETRLQREAQPRYWLDVETTPSSDFERPDAIDASLFRAIPCGAGSAALVDQVPEGEALPDL